jgi:hypothetical protein
MTTNISDDELFKALERTQEKGKARRIAVLMKRYYMQSLTPAEHDELDEWVGASANNLKLFEELTDPARVTAAMELLSGRPSLLYTHGYQHGRARGAMVAGMIAIVIEIIFMQLIK